MDAAVDPMVGRRSLLAVASGFILTGCAWLPFGETACPEITDTSAWINRMPGPGQSGGKLHVVVRVADEQSWRLGSVPTVRSRNGSLPAVAEAVAPASQNRMPRQDRGIH